MIFKTQHKLLGFTLVEMLVATALLAMLSSMLFFSLNEMSRATKNALAKGSSYQDVRVVMDQLARELQQAMVITTTPANRIFSAEASASKTNLNFIASIDNRSGADEVEVHYYFDTTNTLYKSYTYVSDGSDYDFRSAGASWWNTPTDPTSPLPTTSTWASMIDGVKAFEMQFFTSYADLMSGTYTSGWSAGNNTIPAYARITIGIFDSNLIRRWRYAAAVPNSFTNQVRRYQILVHLPQANQ